MACSKEVNNFEEEVYTCQVCLEVYEDRILSCVNGHACCGACASKMTRCAECRDERGYPNNNTALVKMLRNMIITCPECDKKVEFTQFSEHMLDHKPDDQWTKFREYFKLFPRREVKFFNFAGNEVGTLTLEDRQKFTSEWSIADAGLVPHRQVIAGQTKQCYKCTECMIIVADFEDQDIPLLEHFKFSPQCTFILKKAAQLQRHILSDVIYSDNGNVAIRDHDVSTCKCAYNFKDARAFVRNETAALGRIRWVNCAHEEARGDERLHVMTVMYDQGFFQHIRHYEFGMEDDDYSTVRKVCTGADAMTDACSCASLVCQEEHDMESVPIFLSEDDLMDRPQLGRNFHVGWNNNQGYRHLYPIIPIPLEVEVDALQVPMEGLQMEEEDEVDGPGEAW